jgi:hypothetical protein
LRDNSVTILFGPGKFHQGPVAQGLAVEGGRKHA